MQPCFDFIRLFYVTLNTFFKNFRMNPGTFSKTTFIYNTPYILSKKAVIIQANAQKHKQHTLRHRYYYRRKKKCHKQSGRKTQYTENQYTLSQMSEKLFRSSSAIFTHIISQPPCCIICLSPSKCYSCEFSILFRVTYALYSSVSEFTNSASMRLFGVMPLSICILLTASAVGSS